jgi:hypothetical protein
VAPPFDHVAEPSALERGSRANLALLARHAASNRHVRLVSDLIEDRPATLAQPTIEYPIKVTTGVGSCTALVAVPLSRSADVNIVLRDKATRVLVGRDARGASEAAIDLCPLAPGDYVLDLTFGGDHIASPVAIGLFESTPGLPGDPPYGNAIPARMDRK